MTKFTNAEPTTDEFFCKHCGERIEPYSCDGASIGWYWVHFKNGKETCGMPEDEGWAL
jgi:hypothetical protein